MRNDIMTVKGLSRLLYGMGRTFDGLHATLMATEDFLRTGNPDVLGSRNDLALLQDLRDAAPYTLAYEYGIKPFDLSYVRGAMHA